MTWVRRVVFDTSTLVSSAIRFESIPNQALTYALDHRQLCATEHTLAELEGVLQRGKFQRYLSVEMRQSFISLVRKNALLFQVEQADHQAVQPPCREPKETQFLTLALVAEAVAIVSSDDDLLSMHPWRGIEVLKLGEFLISSGIPPRSTEPA
jgi:putative PIN family toxin of toxin-antitoxin system